GSLWKSPCFYTGNAAPVPGHIRMDRAEYVHGYSEREAERLSDQARTLTSLLHHDIRYPDGSRVLEAGCGTGAQTVILARNSPGAEITSIDISPSDRSGMHRNGCGLRGSGT